MTQVLYPPQSKPSFWYGSEIYIYLTFATNTALVIFLAKEAIQTRVWKDLLYLDYMDPRSLIIAGSMDGCAVAHEAKTAWADRTRPM